MSLRKVGTIILVGAAAAAIPVTATRVNASSHREAPFVTKNPKIDASDFYMFSSYEPARAGYVTLIANYIPVQEPAGGPNFFTMDPEALYEIHIDNDGDAHEDLTFQLRFQNTLKNITLPVGPAGSTKDVAVPFMNVGPITAADTSKLNVEESYTIKLVRGNRRTGTAVDITNVTAGGTTFKKPVDNIGNKSIAAYGNYADAHIFEISIPGCTPPAGTKPRVFVGQRKDPFAVNLGGIFDLINIANPLGAADQGLNSLANKNITSIELEVPASCLVHSPATTIGGWTTASMRQARVINPEATYGSPAREGGPWAQVSRLGMPLVNEVVIGLKDKDRFNSSEPSGDAQFIDYVTNPTLPEVVEILFGAAGVQAPNKFPRTDLVAVFLTGVTGVNATATPSEMLRLNTALPVTPRAMQNTLGAAACFTFGTLVLTNAGCDPAGFPNGRRPGDDVVDIALRVVMGYLLSDADAPSGQFPFVDGASVKATDFGNAFPYLNAPLPGMGS